jgi:hypothetical protein
MPENPSTAFVLTARLSFFSSSHHTCSAGGWNTLTYGRDDSISPSVRARHQSARRDVEAVATTADSRGCATTQRLAWMAPTIVVYSMRSAGWIEEDDL